MLRELILNAANFYSLHVNPDFGTDTDCEMIMDFTDSLMWSTSDLLNLYLNIETVDHIISYLF